MADFWLITWLALVVSTIICLSLVGYRLAKAAKRISRSIDPIDQKFKALRLEVSALKHARSDRQRRLKKVNNPSMKKG